MKGLENRNIPNGESFALDALGHELGNVLHGLLGMAQLLRESGLAPEQARWLCAIEHAGQHMYRLLHSMRLRGDRVEEPWAAQPEVFDGIALLEDLLHAHTPAAQRNGDRLLLVAAGGLRPEWAADPCLLRQALDNLVVNAIRFTQRGEVVVSAASDRQGNLLLTVSDSGPGIEANAAGTIFEAYRRGAEQRPADAAGRGLGLFIGRRCVEAMGGWLDFHDAPGGGALFRIRLPGAAARADGARLPSSRILRGLHCRLELHGALRASVAACLDRLGVAYSGSAAAITAGRPGVTLRGLPRSDRDPGPHLRLRCAAPAGDSIAPLVLRAPILASNLGPALMQLALRWRRVRRGKPG
jgi:hypothetical protein